MPPTHVKIGMPRKRPAESEPDLGPDDDDDDEEEEEEEEVTVTRTRSRARREGQSGATNTKNVQPAPAQLQAEDDDSDDAPEEVTMSQARGESIAAHKAAVEGRRALADQKRAQNRLKAENLRQAKEAAAIKKEQKKDAGLELLPPELLEELEEDEAKRKQELRANKKKPQGKVIKFTEAKKERVERGGFVLQKVRSNKHAIAQERISVAEEASALLSGHFGKIARQEYSSVHSRKLGPGRAFGSVK